MKNLTALELHQQLHMLNTRYHAVAEVEFGGEKWGVCGTNEHTVDLTNGREGRLLEHFQGTLPTTITVYEYDEDENGHLQIGKMLEQR